MTSEAMTPVAQDDPLMIAWKAYQETDDYKNSKYWALRLAPFLHAPSESPAARHVECEIMSLDQRERHVQGSLWAAFMAGFRARPSSQPDGE